MSEEINGSASGDDKGIKKDRMEFVKSMTLSITSLLFGSLLFSGIIEGYKDDLSSKRAIVTEQFRPMRETATSCHNSHNKLALAYNNLADSYVMLLNEVKRVANEGDALGPDYAKIGEAVLALRNENDKKVEDLKRDTDACYDKLWRQYEEVSIVTASYDDFLRMSSSHATKINAIYKKREEDIHRIVGDTDMSQLWENFVQLVRSGSNDRDSTKKYIDENRKLFSVPIESNYYMAKNETEILNERDSVMEKTDVLFAKKINNLFGEGFFHRLFRLI